MLGKESPKTSSKHLGTQTQARAFVLTRLSIFTMVPHNLHHKVSKLLFCTKITSDLAYQFNKANVSSSEAQKLLGGFPDGSMFGCQFLRLHKLFTFLCLCNSTLLLCTPMHLGDRVLHFLNICRSLLLQSFLYNDHRT